MYTVLMDYRRYMAHTALSVAALFCISALVGCGGRKIPDHDGYRTTWKKGWAKPKTLEFDEDFEAEVDGELSYIKRKRARWFVIELLEDGELDIGLQVAPIGEDAEEEEEEDVDDPFDVAFELYDEQYKMLLRADREEDDAGDRKKDRTAYELPKGKYLIHLYLQRRLDEAEYTLRLKFRRGSVEPQTDFPAQVAMVDVLSKVPKVDDAPPPKKRKPRKKCRGSKCKKRPRSKKVDNDAPPSDDVLKAKIVVIRGQSGGGTEITLNRGRTHGVDKGWKGKLVTKSGKSIPGGKFTIKSVKTNTSKAKVNVSSDAVKQAGRARLYAP